MLDFGALLQLQIRDAERIPYNKAGRTAADTLTPSVCGCDSLASILRVRRNFA